MAPWLLSKFEHKTVIMQNYKMFKTVRNRVLSNSNAKKYYFRAVVAIAISDRRPSWVVERGKLIRHRFPIQVYYDQWV